MNPRKLLQAVEQFRATGPGQMEATVTGLSIFILAAEAHEQGGIKMAEVQRELSLTSATASRQVAALTKLHRLGKPGLDLVEAVPDPEDNRQRVLLLTPKGVCLARRIEGVS